MRTHTSQRLAEYLTVGEAAEFLGVSAWTLRNWDKSGKLKPLRHPKNGYRIYRHEELQAILDPQSMGAVPSPTSSTIDWSDVGEREHFVQFYDSDDYLVETVGAYVATGIRAGQTTVVIATREHRDAIRQKLNADNLGISDLHTSGQFIALDAEETLGKFMVNGSPDAKLFHEVVGGVVQSAVASGRKLRAFGEMVAILWKNGNRAGAIRLEELWNELAKTHSFALFCAYPIGDCGSVDLEMDFGHVCAHHSRVIPAESYGELNSQDERLRLISALQQKAGSLAAEIAHRHEVEKSLARRERELREHDKRKDEFLAMLAHELRNPLAPISNALEMMKLGDNDSQLIDEARDIMERQVRQMVRIVDDLLDISRITRGTLELRKESVELNAIIRNAVETSTPLIETSGHRLHVELPSQPVSLEVDLARLAQVCANLLNNSAKYTPTGGDIWLIVEALPLEIVIRVKDNGVGISTDALPTVFEMFRQVDQSIARSQGGLGVGLTLVKRLVELHGGTVQALSDGLDKGSEFIVRLPRTCRVETAPDQTLDLVAAVPCRTQA